MQSLALLNHILRILNCCLFSYIYFYLLGRLGSKYSIFEYEKEIIRYRKEKCMEEEKCMTEKMFY